MLIYGWHFVSQLIKCVLNQDIKMFRHFNKKTKKYFFIRLNSLLSNLKDHNKLQTSLYLSTSPLSYHECFCFYLFVYKQKNANVCVFQTDEMLRCVRHKSAKGCLSPPTVRPLHSAFIASPAEMVGDLEVESPPFYVFKSITIMWSGPESRIQ